MLVTSLLCSITLVKTGVEENLPYQEYGDECKGDTHCPVGTSIVKLYNTFPFTLV